MRVLFLESDPLWVHGLPNGFRDAGHDVKVSGPLTEGNIAELIAEFCPDLIVTMGWTAEHSPHKLQWLRRHVRGAGVPHVYWATEDPGYTHRFSLPYLQLVQPDFVFTICPRTLNAYKSLGIKAAYLDFGYQPDIHTPVASDDRYTHAVVVVARAYPRLCAEFPDTYRCAVSLQTLIRPLLAEQIRVDFYGKYWDAVGPCLGQEIPGEWLHGHLPYTETNKAYSSAEIVIGLQNGPTEVTQRTYEVLGSGGLLLTNDTPGVRRLFTPGRDLVTSAAPADTVRLVRYYLAHPAAARQIRAQGRQAVSAHTYRQRAEYMLGVLAEEGIFAGHGSQYDLEAIENAIARALLVDGGYVVRAGDTLWGTSRKLDIPVEAIKRLNGLKSDTVYIGQILKIGRPAVTTEGESMADGQQGSGQGLQMRRAAPAEAPLVQGLLHRAYAANAAAGFNFTAAKVDLEQVREMISSEETYLLMADGAACGTITLRSDGKPVWFGVSPELQGRGYGARLLAFAEERARQKGWESLVGYTPMSHPWLPAFYQRHGYRPVGTVHEVGKNYDWVLMAKALCADCLVVGAGDTLWGLSRKFGVPVEEIKRRNGLMADTIYVGQILRLGGHGG